jgi:hypothetical protein
MTKVISFSLYGNLPKYTVGAIRNAESKKDYFSDWELRIYHDKTVPVEVLKTLDKLEVNLVDVSESKSEIYYPTKEESKTYGMFWRFVPAGDSGIDYFVSRDTDSRFSEREVLAVNEWIESGNSFHIIREHPWGHTWVINGGMWGCEGGFIEGIDQSIKEYLLTSKWSHEQAADQWFLKECIYPVVKNYAFITDEFINYEERSVPIKRDRALDDFAFIGEPFDENENYDQSHRDLIKKYYNQMK